MTEFERIHKKHHASIYRFVLSKVHNHADAEEIVQDTFFEFSKRMHEFELRNDGKPLLVNMAKWKIGIFRSRIRLQFEPIEKAAIPIHHKFPEPLPTWIRKAMLKLKPTLKQALAMYYYGDMTFIEIARAAGIGTSGAEYRVKEGLGRIRMQMHGGLR